MTATLHRLGTGREAGLYYTNDAAREARPRNRDEYYTSDGGGVWYSTGQTIVSQGSHVIAETFRDLCAGFDPRTGKALVRGAGEKHRAGFDLTFTPGKSVSVLWMSGTAEQRAFIERCHGVAVDRALKILIDENLVVVRHGAGGRHRETPSDLIVAKFDHFTTRAGDPNLHTHCVILNVAGRSSASDRYASNYLTLEPENLFRAQLLVGAAFRSALSSQLAEAGFSFRPAGQGQWEIAGIPQDLLETFSKRSHDIEDLVGREASAAQKQIAALNTRAAKETVLTGQELEADWQRQLRASGHSPWDLAQHPTATHSGPEQDVALSDFQEPPAIPGSTPVAMAASDLFRTESVLDRQKLLEKSFVAASLQGHGPDAVYAELDTLESSGTLLKLDVEHWTTPEIAQMEAAMLRAADRPGERVWVKPDCLETALAKAPHLGDEQIEAVRLACSADGVSLIEAGAGTGKTTIAEAITMAARQSNLQLVGLAPSWIAADELSASTGIDGQAIAKWRHDLAIGTAVPLSSDTLILVDEAGMIGTSDMSAILSTAKEAGAKVILLGDRRQLQSVSGASALVAVADILERTATLHDVRRQQVDWQRAASILMARGETEAGLRAYARHGCVDLVSGEDAARTATVEKWSELRHRLGEIVLIVTRRNVDAIAISSQARLALRQEGKIAPDEILLPSIGRDDKKRDLAISVGDRIRFGEAIPKHGVRNGTLAVVQALGDDAGADTQIQLRLENGVTISSRWGEFIRPRLGRQSSSPKISHAYAGTAHAAQGRTAAGTIFHVGGKTDARDIYVGLTRHRQEAHVVVESSRLDAACRLRQDDSRIQPTSTAMLERLFSESQQYREKTNVVDHVNDRNDFIATGKVSISEPDNGWSIRSALRASLRLSILARSFQTLWRVVTSVVSPELRKRTPLPEHLRTLRQDINQWDDARERDARRPHYDF